MSDHKAQAVFWKIVTWLASRRLKDPCRWSDTLYADQRFKLQIGRTGREKY